MGSPGFLPSPKQVKGSLPACLFLQALRETQLLKGSLRFSPKSRTTVGQPAFSSKSWRAGMQPCLS
jgi:hypothetical protein